MSFLPFVPSLSLPLEPPRIATGPDSLTAVALLRVFVMADPPMVVRREAAFNAIVLGLSTPRPSFSFSLLTILLACDAVNSGPLSGEVLRLVAVGLRRLWRFIPEFEVELDPEDARFITDLII